MSDDTIKGAFLSPLADDLFATVAAFTDGKDLAEIDVEAGHRAVRRALTAALQNGERRRRSTGSRLVAINGATGSGKTHVLTMAFREAAADPAREVYPVVLQLTAPVRVDEYDVWLLDALFRELGARHFPDEQGRSPLRRIADRLLERVSPDDRYEFVNFIDDLEDDGEIILAKEIGERIRRQGMSFMKELPPSAAFLGALLLAGYGDASAVVYLQRGQLDDRMRFIGALPIENPTQRFGVIQSLGLAIELAGGTLALALDQVENSIQLGSEQLFAHAVRQAIRVAEAIPTATVALVMLRDAFEKLAAAGVSRGDLDRLVEESPPSVEMTAPSPELVEQVLRRRLQVMRRRAGLASVSEGAAKGFAPLPEALVAEAQKQQSLRQALRVVSAFRQKVVDAGSWEYSSEKPAKKPDLGKDFDKLWADFHDMGSAVEARILTAEKAEILRWWSEAAGSELSGRHRVISQVQKIDEPKTHVVDIEVLLDGAPVVRRQLALCDAKNQHNRLRKQVEAFLEWSEGVPFAYRDKGFPKGRTAQVAPALDQLRASEGFVVEVAPSEWTTLLRAREFQGQHATDPSFAEWSRSRQWLRQLVKPLDVLVEPPVGRLTPEDAPSPTTESADPSAEPPAPSASRDAEPFPVEIGQALAGGDGDPIVWDPYRAAPNALNNSGFLVTGDPGSGKTQTIRVLIDAACRAQLPVLIFDFKADYGDTKFAEPLGLEVVNVRKGLPFNPLRPMPRGASGAQPAEHAYEIAGILKRVFGLGDVQEGKLRDALHVVYEEAGIPPREWVDPEAHRWPTFDAVVARLREDRSAANIVTRLAPLVELGLLPSVDSGQGFSDFLGRRIVLSLAELPTDEIKMALAEMLIVQIHGHVLRGAQPRRLARLLVFDEAHRVAGSRRLEALGREGRAFGIGMIVGTQFPGDVPEDLAGTLATSLLLMNSQADHRRAIVRKVLGTTSSAEARTLTDELASLRPLEGLFVNAHYRRPTLVRVRPHHERMA